MLKIGLIGAGGHRRRPWLRHHRQPWLDPCRCAGPQHRCRGRALECQRVAAKQDKPKFLSISSLSGRLCRPRTADDKPNYNVGAIPTCLTLKVLFNMVLWHATGCVESLPPLGRLGMGYARLQHPQP